MAHAITRARIDMRVDSETKQLAELAAAALGCSSLTEFLTRLIRENAPDILEHETTIRLAADRFDQFVAACQSTDCTPSQKIRDAARRLDAEGY